MKKILTLLAVFSVAFVCQIRGTINPGMDLLYQQFHTYSKATVSLMTNICSLAIIFSSYLAGKKAGIKWTYRQTIIMMFVVLLIGGLGPYLATNLWIMLFFRFLFGIGIGIAIALHRPLIMACFSGTKQIKYLGYDTIVASIGMMFFQTLVGLLCDINWRLMFLGYLPIIFLLLLSYYIPDIKLVSNNKQVIKQTINIDIKLFILIFLLLSVFTNCISVNQSTLLSLKKLNDPVILTTTVSNINALFSLISGLFFSQIYKVFKNKMLIISLLLTALSIVLFMLGNNEIMMYLAGAIFGFFYNLVVLYLFLIPSQIVDASLVSMIGGYMGVAAGIGGFLATFIMYLCEIIFHDIIYPSYIMAIMIMIISALIVYWICKKNALFNKEV